MLGGGKEGACLGGCMGSRGVPKAWASSAFGMASRSPGSVVPRNVYYPKRGESSLCGTVYGITRLRSHDELSPTCLVRNRPNLAPKLKRPSKSELINGVEQTPNGIPNEKKRVRVGGRGTRGIRAKEEKECGLGILHWFVHSRSQQMTARIVVAYVTGRRP
jgi:hypothetical protein